MAEPLPQPLNYQSLPELSVWPEVAQAPRSPYNLCDRLGRGAVNELGKTPASSVRLGTEFGYEHQCFRGGHEIAPTNIVITFQEDVSSI